MNKEILIKITAEEFMRMQGIKLDNDEKDALAMVKLLVSRVEADERRGMKSHLDQSQGR
jgi:hypothetical protein